MNHRKKQYEIDAYNGLKICVSCDIKQDLDNFLKYRNCKTRRSQCKSCDNKQIELPSQMEIDIKRNHKICSKCNESKDLLSFDKDHRFNLYLADCKDCVKLKTNRNRNKRHNKDKNYRLIVTIRNRIKRVLNGIRKSDKSFNLVGCSLPELKLYLESKFLPGMTWDNHGYGDNCWHIDHVLPCAAFDLTKEEHQRKCFHYSNMQPLWQKDNLIKNDKLPNGICVQQMSKGEISSYLSSNNIVKP